MSKNVLIIDNAVFARNSSSLLSEQGYSVDLAHNHEVGLQKLDSQDHDVIILQETPEAESWRLCEEIRRMTSVPLIVVSKNASVETSVKAIKAGADYFMRKSCGSLELLARIRALLRRSPLN